MTAPLTFSRTTGVIAVQKADGTLRWSSDYPPANLLTAAEKIAVTGQVVSFPDFDKSNYEWQSVWDSGAGAVSAATSWVTILPGEWGPDETAPYLLSRTLLGTVPSGVNYLSVHVNGSRTTDPSQFQGAAVPKVLPESVDVWLDGGCAILEQTPAFVRGIKIVLSGTNVYLERYQSVRYTPQASSPLKADPQTYTSGSSTPWNNIWTHGGDKRGHLAYEIDYKNSGSVNKYRGGSNEPSTTDPTDYASEWTLDITVWPGVIDESDIEHASLPAAPSPAEISFRGVYATEVPPGAINGSPTSTYYSPVDLGTEYQGRRIAILIASYLRSTSTGPQTVMVNGVSAVEKCGAVYNTTQYAGIWTADIPAGQGASIAVEYDGDGCQGDTIGIYALNGLAAATPDDTDVQGGISTSKTATVSTVNGGFALGVIFDQGIAGSYTGPTGGMTSDSAGTYDAGGYSNVDHVEFLHIATSGSSVSLGGTVSGRGIAIALASFH